MKDDLKRVDSMQGAKILKSSHFLKMFSLGRKISLVCVATGKPRSPFKYGGKIKTEEKAKVVAAVWGTELIQFLAALAFLHQDYLKKGMNSSYSSYRPGAIHPMLPIVLEQNS